MHRSAYAALVATVIATSAATTEEQESLARRGKEPATAAESVVERTLFALEADWTRALVRRDGATFDRLLARAREHRGGDGLARHARSRRERSLQSALSVHRHVALRDGRWRVIAAHDYPVPDR